MWLAGLDPIQYDLAYPKRLLAIHDTTLKRAKPTTNTSNQVDVLQKDPKTPTAVLLQLSTGSDMWRWTTWDQTVQKSLWGCKIYYYNANNQIDSMHAWWPPKLEENIWKHWRYSLKKSTNPDHYQSPAKKHTWTSLAHKSNVLARQNRQNVDFFAFTARYHLVVNVPSVRGNATVYSNEKTGGKKNKTQIEN